MNNACKLNWTFVERCKQVDFLDLTIWLDPSGNISTRTFQKPMNLFLYITPDSAHPPGLIKSLVFGLLLTYYKHNTNSSDFLCMTSLLFQRLLNRSHQHNNLSDIFMSAITKIENNTQDIWKKTGTKSTEQENRLFFHIPFHPRDISRKEIRNIYNNTCQSDSGNGSFKNMRNFNSRSIMKIDKLTVAYSQPRNLGDLLVPSTLQKIQ